MNKLLLWLALLLSPMLVIGQDSIETSNHDIEISAIEAPIVLHVYPSPIIDQFRIDLRDFQGQHTKIEVIRLGDGKAIYTKELSPSSSSIQLSAYAIGMLREDYKVRMTCDGISYETTVRLD